MKLTWLGHACFLLESPAGRLVIDPYAPGSVPGLENIAVQADRVLCSHDHFDHNAVDSVSLTGRQDGWQITALPTVHDHHGGSRRGANTVHIFRSEGKTVVHLGDLGCLPEQDVLDAIREPDVLLIPVGGHYTMTPAEAAQLVRTVQPKLTVPMHYRGGFGFPELATAEPFLQQVGGYVRLTDSTVDLDAPPDAPVAVLQPKLYTPMSPKELLSILSVAEKLKCNTRHCYTSSGRHESVAEHAWRSALMAMLLAPQFPQVDVNRVIRMLLIHDLGEAFTGDIPAFEKTDGDAQKESHLLQDWVSQLHPDAMLEFSVLLAEMEEMQTPEARLYKAMDKLEAIIQHNESALSTWLPLEYDLQLTYGQENMAFSPVLQRLRAEIDDVTRRKIESGV